jgi:thiamine kinase-like enzyme
MSMPDIDTRLAKLTLWGGPIDVEPLPGGMTNRNLLIRSPLGRFVARVAGNSRVHGIDRLAEQAATRAAARAGLGPELVWAEADLMILRHVEGHTLESSDFARNPMPGRIVALLRRIDDVMPGLYDGPTLDRTPAALLWHYSRELLALPNRWCEAVAALMPTVAELTTRLGPMPRGFAHNDIHGANIIDDGDRLWLVDWEYAGRGQAMVDVASLVNNGLFSQASAQEVLATWLGRPPHLQDLADLAAMRLAAALRDLFWGYAQDALIAPDHGELDRYIAINQERVAEASMRAARSFLP